MATVSSTAGINQNSWQQLALQQATRSADQAERAAQSLKAQANDAQRTAERERENARSLSVRSDQAQARAGQIRQTVAELRSSQQGAGQVSKTLDQAVQRQAAPVTVAPSASAAPATTGTAPAVNSQGQVTGTIISTMA